MSAVRGSRGPGADGPGADTSDAKLEQGPQQEPADAAHKTAARAACCPFYHEAVELVGRRWTGAIIRVLMDRPMRFSEISQAVPELSDRLLSERMKELEGRGIVERTVHPGPPVRVEYSLSTMGRELSPALLELQRWARRWLSSRDLA